MPVILTGFIVSSFFLYYLSYINNDKVVNIWVYKNKSLIKYLLALSNFLISFTLIFSYSHILSVKFNMSKYVFYPYIISVGILVLISYIVALIKKDKFIDVLNKALINLIIYKLVLFPITVISCLVMKATNITYYEILSYTLTKELEYLQTYILNYISIIISATIFIMYKIHIFFKRREKF